MQFDYGSVLIAVGAAGIAFCFTLITNWLRQRASSFLMTWGISMAIIVASVAGFSIFSATGESWAGLVGSLLLTTGFAVNYGGTVQFGQEPFPARHVIVFSVATGLPVALAYAFGFDGMGFWLVNLGAAILATIGGAHYWRIRGESPGPISTISGLHFLLAASFVLCSIVGVIEAPLHLVDGSPENWAEVLNLVCCVIAITGIGGLLITVHQERISRGHQINALTDPLTGLYNRRALFEEFADGGVPKGTAFIVFDLDDFKGHNDRFGHGFGDGVLRDFGRLLTANLRTHDMAVRLGGEEFVVVLPGSSSVHGLAVAERIRNEMARREYITGDTPVVCTVSAGVSFAGKDGYSLDTLLRKADNALYLSKRNGRNQVTPVPSNAAA